MDDLSREEIIDSQITGSIYDAKGYVGSCGYSESLKDDVISRYGDPRQKAQGQYRQRLIDEIDARGLEVAAMLTISPYSELDLSDRNALMEYIFHSTTHRFITRDRKPLYLGFYEKNKRNDGYHLHLLFFKLPRGKSCLGKVTLTKGVAEAVISVTGRDCIPAVYLDQPRLHADLYNFAIRNPYNLEGRGHLYRGSKYVPKSAQGLRWSVVGQYQLDADGKPRNQFDGFYGWHGLVAYCTKHIFSGDLYRQNIDGFSYNALINSPVVERNRSVDLSTFFTSNNE